MSKENSVSSALARLGFETVGQVSYTTWNGYAVSVQQNAPYSNIEVAARADKKDKQLAKTLRSAVKAQCPKGITGCANNGQHFTFTAVLNKKTPYDDQLSALLDAITAAMKENGVAPACTCAVCGGSGPDSLCLVSTYQPVHAACVRNLSEDTKAAAEQNQEQGSYALGLVGAIIGMLVGLIPNVLTIVFGERIYALLFALVPLAAMFGYRQLRGKQNAVAIVIVVILSLLSVFVLQCMTNAIYLMQEYSVSFGEGFTFMVQYLFTGEGFVAFLQDGVSEFLFMALGILVAWKYIFQTNTSHVAAMNAVVGTLRPIAGEVDAQEETPDSETV